MTASLKESIRRQRQELADKLAQPLADTARRCAQVWPDRECLNAILLESLPLQPFAQYLYALDTNGIQISDNISADGLMPEHFGRDRSERPYMNQVLPCVDFRLSDAYISLMGKRPSLTALQLVRREGRVLGFIGMDFDLRTLPLTRPLYKEPDHWRQIKGDPVIRGQVFYQCRVDSPMDRNIDDVLALLEELMVDHGVFQCKIHFSSSRATIIPMADPYRYRILDYDMLTDPDVCLAYPHREYPADALIPADQIRPIFSVLRELRFIDETFYLRSAGINIFNGMISLTFSCDGSHYMRFDEFLTKGGEFWTNAAGARTLG